MVVVHIALGCSNLSTVIMEHVEMDVCHEILVWFSSFLAKIISVLIIYTFSVDMNSSTMRYIVHLGEDALVSVKCLHHDLPTFLTPFPEIIALTDP